MTQRNISRATSRVTECLFYIVVFAFMKLFNSEQRLDDYILFKGPEKSPLYCVICILRAKMRYVILLGMTKSPISGRMDVENSISTVIFQILTR